MAAHRWQATPQRMHTSLLKSKARVKYTGLERAATCKAQAQYLRRQQNARSAAVRVRHRAATALAQGAAQPTRHAVRRAAMQGLTGQQMGKMVAGSGAAATAAAVGGCMVSAAAAKAAAVKQRMAQPMQLVEVAVTAAPAMAARGAAAATGARLLTRRLRAITTGRSAPRESRACEWCYATAIASALQSPRALAGIACSCQACTASQQHMVYRLMQRLSNHSAG